MNERFDDMIRRRLQGHESNVPAGLFDAISQRGDVQDTFFDNAVRSKLDKAESPVPVQLFDAISKGAELEYLDFDSIMRSKAENAISPVPADTWHRITTEKNRRRRPVAWWWVAATALFLVTGGGVFHLLKSAYTSQSVTNTAAEKVAPNAPIISRKGAAEAAIVNRENATGANEPDSTSVPAPPTETNSTPSVSVANHTIQPVPHTVFRKKFSILPSGSKEDFETIAANPEKTIPNETLNDSYPSSSQGSDQATTHLVTLSLLRNTSRFIPGQLLQANPHNPVIPCPAGSNDKHTDWYVEVYGSAFLLQKEVRDQYLGKNAKAGFDSTLHQQVSFNAGINLVKSLGENFLLKTGLQYNRINESFRLTQVNERRLITTISVRTVIIAPGDTVRIRDTATIEQIGTAQYRTQNRYTQWDVPVIIGYTFGSENLKMNANVGLIANIRSSYQGEMLADSTRKIFDINNYHGQSVYRKTVGFSLYAGLSFIKSLSGKTSLIVEPYTRIGLSNVTNSQAWFNQKNSMMGLSIGLRYKLNGGRQHIY